MDWFNQRRDNVFPPPEPDDEDEDEDEKRVLTTIDFQGVKRIG
mgnify:CR=1